jgi:hypothetical protein
MNELLSLVQQQLALRRRQPSAQRHQFMDDGPPPEGRRCVQASARASPDQEAVERGPPDGERAGEHPARDQGDEELDQHARRVRGKGSGA